MTAHHLYCLAVNCQNVLTSFGNSARLHVSNPNLLKILMFQNGVQSASVFAPRSRPTFARCRISAPPKPRPRNGFSTARDVNTATVFLCISMPPHATMRFPRRTERSEVRARRFSVFLSPCPAYTRSTTSGSCHAQTAVKAGPHHRWR